MLLIMCFRVKWVNEILQKVIILNYIGIQLANNIIVAFDEFLLIADINRQQEFFYENQKEESNYRVIVVEALLVNLNYLKNPLGKFHRCMFSDLLEIYFSYEIQEIHVDLAIFISKLLNLAPFHMRLLL